ncbi:hypothetical protein GE061_008335 [Apolygus lucorum]|uniref:CCHC-type domain-containing protein n=1 Tax=Apolygus lucorum TaxID=248454 RepID=A0A8S9WPK6_APOLU|nr:hypothetical protein GE061_008335 [Apolygus lucorum]
MASGDNKVTAELADAMTEAMNRMGEFFRTAQTPAQGQNQQPRDLPRSLFLEIEPWNPDDSDSISAASFFAEVDQATHDLDQEQKLRFLRTRLRGGAKRFLQEDLGAQPYTNLRDAILQWYESEDPEKAMIRLWTTKRQPEESIRRFAEKLIATAKTAVRNEVNLTAAQQREWVKTKTLRAFVRGINKEISPFLQSNLPDTLEEAVKRAEDLDDDHQSEKAADFKWDIAGVLNKDSLKCYTCGEAGHFAGKCPQKTTPQGPSRSQMTTPPHTGQSRPGWKQPSPSPRYPCLYCGDYSHFPVNCPHGIQSTIFCDFCGAREHLENECLRKKKMMPVSQPRGSVTSPTAAVVTLPPEDIPEEEIRGDEIVAFQATVNCTTRPMIRMKIGLGKYNRDVILDTGAAVSALSHPVPGVPVQPTSTELWGADGQKIPLLGTQELTVRIGDRRASHRFYIFERPDSHLDLVGLDLLKRFPIGIRTDTKHVTMASAESGVPMVLGAVWENPKTLTRLRQLKLRSPDRPLTGYRQK